MESDPLSMTDMVEGIPNYVEATPSTSNSTEKQNTETEESSSTASNSKHFEDEEHEETNLFVGDLSRDIDEEQLLAAFANFGEVADVTVKRSKITKLPLGYGFVQMKTHQAACNAIEKLNGTYICDRPIRIGWARGNSYLNMGQRRRYPDGLDPVVSIYVQFRTVGEEAMVTEEHLHSIFSSFGEVESVHIKSITREAYSTKQRGWGFVHFQANDAGRVAAVLAVQECSNVIYNGLQVTAELSRNFRRAVGPVPNGCGGGGGGAMGQRPTSVHGHGHMQPRFVYYPSPEFGPAPGGQEMYMVSMPGHAPLAHRHGHGHGHPSQGYFGMQMYPYYGAPAAEALVDGPQAQFVEDGGGGYFAASPYAPPNYYYMK